MGIKATFSILSIIIFTSTASYSKTCLITDIDDTIKISHTQDELSLSNIFHFIANAPFAGSSTLYQNLMCEINGACQESYSNLFYLTSSPEKIDFLQKWFISDNGYPAGRFSARPSSADSFTYKSSLTAEFIESENCTKAILIGDDSSYDSLVYSNVNVEKQVYIHSLYKRPTEKNQTLFYTHADLALRLWEDQLLSEDALYEVLLDAADAMFSYTLLPEWSHCTKEDLTKAFTVPTTLNPARKELVNIIYSRTLDASTR